MTVPDRRTLDLREFARLFFAVPDSTRMTGRAVAYDSIMPDSCTPEPDALAAFASETDGSQPAVAPVPLRGPREGTPLAAMPIKDERVSALIHSVQAVATESTPCRSR